MTFGVLYFLFDFCAVQQAAHRIDYLLELVVFFAQMRRLKLRLIDTVEVIIEGNDDFFFPEAFATIGYILSDGLLFIKIAEALAMV